jgi:6-phosphofructokinase 1
MTVLADLSVARLGEPRFDSPLAGFVADRRSNEHYVDEDDRVIFHDTVSQLTSLASGGGQERPAGPTTPEHWPSFEPGGPRRRLFFPPGSTKVAIVTCGGLCPGLNDVIRGLVMELAKHYGIAGALGYRHGFAGMVRSSDLQPLRLTPASVHDINQRGGTILGSSRGAQDPDEIIDRLIDDRIDILFVIGGDGSMRGAAGLARRLAERSLPIGVVGVPKTIDNDIPFIGQSFGFVTSFGVAAQTINAAMVEAHAAVGGVGLVKLMGRHAGFIACYAALANHEADFVLIPEVPFSLDGPAGFLSALHQRVRDTGHAVVVVAEGAGQDVLAGTGATDPSGNKALADIGLHLRAAITAHFRDRGSPLTLKYLDPGYAIRSVRADPHDSVYCVRLAQAAVHAGMAGRTDMVVGRRHNRFVHVPISLVVSQTNQVARDGDLWLSVLESTAQPASMV